MTKIQIAEFSWGGGGSGNIQQGEMHTFSKGKVHRHIFTIYFFFGSTLPYIHLKLPSDLPYLAKKAFIIYMTMTPIILDPPPPLTPTNLNSVRLQIPAEDVSLPERDLVIGRSKSDGLPELPSPPSPSPQYVVIWLLSSFNVGCSCLLLPR